MQTAGDRFPHPEPVRPTSNFALRSAKLWLRLISISKSSSEAKANHAEPPSIGKEAKLGNS